jgi:hypothetical protein
LIKTYVALWESCRSIAPLQLSFLEIFNLVGTFWSYAISKQAKWNEKRPERRNARPRSASRGHPALAFAPGPYTVTVAGPRARARTVPRPCGPAHLDTGQVAIAREPPSAPPVTRAGRRTSKPPLPGSWTRQLVPRANGTFLGSPPPRIPLLIRRQKRTTEPHDLLVRSAVLHGRRLQASLQLPYHTLHPFPKTRRSPRSRPLPGLARASTGIRTAAASLPPVRRRRLPSTSPPRPSPKTRSW